MAKVSCKILKKAVFNIQSVQRDEYDKLPLPLENESSDAYALRMKAMYFAKCAPDNVKTERAWLADIAVNSTKEEFVRDVRQYWFQRKLEEIAKTYDKAAAQSRPRRAVHFCGTLADRMGFDKDDLVYLLNHDYYDEDNNTDPRFPMLRKGELGHGMSRVTFPLGENLVIKVCKKGGSECERQNEGEIKVFAEDREVSYAQKPISPRVYEYGEDYLILERVAAGMSPVPAHCPSWSGYNSAVHAVEGWMRGLVGHEVGSLTGRTEVLRDIEGGRFNHILDTYFIEDVHSSNWGINNKCKTVIVDPGFFGNEPKVKVESKKIKVDTPTCYRPNKLPLSLFDFERDGSEGAREAMGDFWDLAQRGKVPGVFGFVAPDTHLLK